MEENKEELIFDNITDENCKILIIDDEPEICEEISEKLEFHGFNCLVATDSKSGLEFINSNKDISIILTDIKMPGMSGLELCKLIGQDISKNRELALLVMTGHAGLSEAIEALKVGALDFLTKPLSPDLLVHSVKRANNHIKARKLERDFKIKLKNQVGIMTIDLQKKAYDLEKLNAALTISDRVKNEFLKMISHELRTPLTAIVGFADIMQAQVEDIQQKVYMHEIKNAGWELTEIVNSMIDMVAVETNTFQINPEFVDISEIITKSVSAYRGKAKQAGITIDTKKSLTYRFKLDPVKISQVVGRIIDNAINFSHFGGTVYISSEGNKEGLKISIQDYGDGMSSSDIKKALEPFRQVDGSFSKENNGIGVGLFLSKIFVELHGGAMEIISKQGSGTNIKIMIPEKGVIKK